MIHKVTHNRPLIHPDSKLLCYANCYGLTTEDTSISLPFINSIVHEDNVIVLIYSTVDEYNIIVLINSIVHDNRIGSQEVHVGKRRKRGCLHGWLRVVWEFILLKTNAWNGF